MTTDYNKTDGLSPTKRKLTGHTLRKTQSPFDTICTAAGVRCDRSTACMLCRLEIQDVGGDVIKVYQMMYIMLYDTSISKIVHDSKTGGNCLNNDKQQGGLLAHIFIMSYSCCSDKLYTKLYSVFYLQHPLLHIQITLFIVLMLF